MRDPSALGGVLLNVKPESLTMAQWASEIDNGMVTEIPNYDSSESMQTVATMQQREEYECRAAEGDSFAQHALVAGNREPLGEPVID